MSPWEPGYRGTYNGEQYRVVLAKDVPRAYWDKYKSAYHTGARGSVKDSWTIYALLTQREALEERVPRSGGVTEAHANHPTYGVNYSCVIPEEFFPQEENEWGTISP